MVHIEPARYKEESGRGLRKEGRAILHAADMLEHRDESRWELDPISAEDYPERSDR